LWTDKALKTIKFATIDKKYPTTVGVSPIEGEGVKEIIVHAPPSAAAQPHFLVHFRGAEFNWAQIYHIDVSTGAAVKAYDLPRLDGKGAFSTSIPGTEVCFVRHTATDIVLLSSVNDDVLGQWRHSSKSEGQLVGLKGILHAASEVVSRGGSKYSLRSALTLSTGDWELVRNGDSLWIRPDGLAGIVAAGFVDIAREEGLAQEIAAEGQSNVLSAYVHRLRRHAKDLKHLPAWLEGLPQRLIGGFLGEKAPVQEQTLRRDSFGFRQIVVVATERGRLAALDTSNRGQVIWNVKVVALQPGSTWEVISIDAEHEHVLVRGKAGEFLRVLPNTGEIVQHQPGGMMASLKTAIPMIGTSGQQVLIPVNEDGSLGDISNAKFGEGLIIVTERTDEIVTGWSLGKNTKPSIAWDFMASAGEKIHSVTPRPAHDPVASIGKALGDRNVLYKYLNPNILLITAVAIEASTATFYLIDSASGAVLHSITHTNVDTTQPISSTVSENFFAYSLFSETTTASHNPSQLDQQKLKGYQLVVSELYESSLPNERCSTGSSQNQSSIYPMPSEDIEPADVPHVISQTYLIPGPISHMSMTSTLQGITPRSLLCVMPRLNALVSIPRHVLDPRRPVGRDPTAAEAEEGLFRYNAVLDLDPRWTLTHKRDLLSLSNVISSPTLLESTSLVLAFGDVDIFGTRSSPIGGFDILGKGFNKLQLVGTVVALAVGTSALVPFVSLEPPRSSLEFARRWLTLFIGEEKANRRAVEGLDACLLFCIKMRRTIEVKLSRLVIPVY